MFLILKGALHHMFPIGDDNSSRRLFPVVTYALVALNVLVFFVELVSGDAFIETWAFVPPASLPTLRVIL